MIRTASSLALASLLFAAPLRAQSPGAPLKTLCSSPTMSYCMNVWSYEWWVSGLFENGFTQSNRIVVETFGEGYAAGGSYFLYFESSAPFASGYVSYLQGGVTASGPGTYTMGDTTGQGFAPDLLAPASVDDLRLLMFAGPAELCYVGVDCHEVPVEIPDPASLLLLAGGLVGLAGTAVRRRV